MASRRLNDLAPTTRERALNLLQGAEGAHFGVLIYCTHRPVAEQARLFRQGRSLSAIHDKARELERVWKRADLAELLIAVGPQTERRIVTWAGPGQSLHNYGFALDAVPLIGGKPCWDPEASPEATGLWQRYGELGLAAGFEWAGNWPHNKREFPHVQEPGVDWRELIAA